MRQSAENSYVSDLPSVPDGSLYLRPDEKEELFFAMHEFGKALGEALPEGNEEERRKKEKLLSTHTEQFRALEELSKRSAGVK